MGKIFRHLKTLHSWMGLIALPWVILFGLSGLYLNHPQLVSQILPDSAYGAEAEMFASLDVPLTPETAANIARQYWPESPMNAIRQIKYHGFDAVEFTRGAGRIIVAKETGHYYTKTNFQNVLYSPQGEAVDRKIYWNYLLGVFHRNGWFQPNNWYNFGGHYRNNTDRFWPQWNYPLVPAKTQANKKGPRGALLS